MLYHYQDGWFILLKSIEVSNTDTLKKSDDKKRDVGAEVVEDSEDVVACPVGKHQGEKAAGPTDQAWHSQQISFRKLPQAT